MKRLLVCGLFGRKIADFGVFVMGITGLLDKTSTAI